MNNFVQKVMARLPEVENSQDRELIIRDATQLGEEGWTCDEVVSLFHCMEEVNPDIPEAIALRCIAAIRSNVEKRLELIKK
jgi:hypothetical protein